MIARRPWQSLGEVVLCSGFPTQLALAGAARLAGLAPLTADGGLSLAFVAAVSAGDTVLLVALVLWLLRRRGESVRDVLCLGHRRQGREVRLGLLLAPLFARLHLLDDVAAPQPVAPAAQRARESIRGAGPHARGRGACCWWWRWSPAASARRCSAPSCSIASAPISAAPSTGLLLTSVAFGLGHVVQGWDAVIVTGLLGRLLGRALPGARQHHRRPREPRPRQRRAGGDRVPPAGDLIRRRSYGASMVTGVRRRRSLT